MDIRLARALPALAAMALVLALASQVAGKRPDGMGDGAIAFASHVALYAVLAALVLFAITHGRSITPGRAVVATVISVGFGIADEINQAAIPGRTANVHDVVADAAGAVTACLIIYAIARWRYRPESRTGA